MITTLFKITIQSKTIHSKKTPHPPKNKKPRYLLCLPTMIMANDQKTSWIGQKVQAVLTHNRTWRTVQNGNETKTRIN